jgi:8-oxo-dGTP pyrophosphatase MutT (NUDIX family)
MNASSGCTSPPDGFGEHSQQPQTQAGPVALANALRPLLIDGDGAPSSNQLGAAPDGHLRPNPGDTRLRRESPFRPASDGHTKAAVLVPIYLAGEEPHVVLTRRRANLRSHAGEISFPGGRFDEDDSTLSNTALREAEEEIGLRREQVSLAGALTPTSTFVTGYQIHPFVGAIDPQRAWTANVSEVDVVLELSLRALRLSRGRTQLTRRGFTFETDAYQLSDHLIWGATFRILQELIIRLAPLLD